MRKFAMLLGLILALLTSPAMFSAPTRAAEEGARPSIIDVLTARLADAASAEEADEIAAALREVYGESESATASVLFTHSVTLAAEGDHEAILTKLDRALILDDRLVAAYVLRGNARLTRGAARDALDDAWAVVELAPDYYAGLGLLARAFEAQGQYASALATTREALRYYPLNEELAEQLARHEALARGAGF